MADGERFLIIRLAGIGDVVMASSLARRLRTRHPAGHVAWLCGVTAAPLVEQLVDVDEVIAVDERRLLAGDAVERLQVLLPLWRRLVAGRYTQIFLLHADARYRVITLPMAGVPVVSQSRRDSHGGMNPIPGRYLGDEFARLMDGLENRGPIVGHFPLGGLKGLPGGARGTLNGRQRVALVPGGARNVLRESALKRWPLDHYVALTTALVAHGCEVLLIGNADDAWVRPSFVGLQTTDLIGRATIPETLQTLASCDLVVSHDTGPMHLARIVGAPLLALFGPTMPAQFVVADEATTVLWGGEHLACRPCYDGREFADCRDNQCISSVSVEVVLRTARTMLQRRSAATPVQRERQTPGETALR